MTVGRLNTSGVTLNSMVENLLKESTGITRSSATARNLNGGVINANHASAFGRFVNGNVSAGTLLPTINRGTTNAAYTGGIGYQQGICLSTGFVDNADPQQGTTSGLGKGVQGPNNGQSLSGGGQASSGDASKNWGLGSDNDIAPFLMPNQSFDHALLSFQSTFANPGILMLRYVHATDEYPNYFAGTYNDSPVVIYKNQNVAQVVFANLIVLRGRDSQGNIIEGPLNLQKLFDCNFMKFNQAAPAPNPPLQARTELQTNGLNFYYDHEYAAFSKLMRCEAKKALPPANYRMKVAMADVQDQILDSAVFFPDDGLELFPFRQGDFNRDGYVDLADYTVWQDNESVRVPTQAYADVTFEEGDANGDLKINNLDYTIWANNYGQTGNIDYCSDFDRNGVVNEYDQNLCNYWSNQGLTTCASRFEGDADEDGDVDDCDLEICQYEWDTGLPLRPCSCQFQGAARLASSKCCGELLDKAGRSALRAAKELEHRALLATAVEVRTQLPKNADANGDGTVNDKDRQLIFAIIDAGLQKGTAQIMDESGGTQPTLEPAESVNSTSIGEVGQ